MSISQVVDEFVTIAIRQGGWMEMDRLYLRNRVMSLIGEQTFTDVVSVKHTRSSIELLEELVSVGIGNKQIGDTESEKEIVEAKLGDFLTPPPSVINAIFAELYEKDVKEATDYFYQISQTNNYIKTKAIANNIIFPVSTDYGELEITINLSKPEKDPKQIALEKSAPQGDYPKCLLCMENEGYEGRLNHPARTNHRIIRLNLDGESWGLQYSPYSYYNEHSIFLSETHRPMVIGRETFERLLSIVALFPHYFVGSNADLPIVGGSILSHDHYQAGRHTFPMAKAPIEKSVDLNLFPSVKAGIVKWPMSVIRLVSTSREGLVNAGYYVLEQWKQYSDDSLEINAFSKDGTPHHTITPIARMNDEKEYELDLVLRDNNVSETHPDGIFHPHRDVQHIKKENIGLIEVMGLAVLPPRLKVELQEVTQFVLGEPNQIASYHQNWAEKMKNTYAFTEDNVEVIIQKEVGMIFAQVLEDAGVFKRDEIGQAGFDKFIQTL